MSEKIEDADKELERKCKLHQKGSKFGEDFGMWSSTVVGFTPAGSSMRGMKILSWPVWGSYSFWTGSGKDS